MDINDKIDLTCGTSYSGHFISLNNYRVAGDKPKPYARVVCSYGTTYRDIADAFSVNELQMMLDYKNR